MDLRNMLGMVSSNRSSAVEPTHIEGNKMGDQLQSSVLTVRCYIFLPRTASTSTKIMMPKQTATRIIADISPVRRDMLVGQRRGKLKSGVGERSSFR